jgi:hypothetical protein
MNEHGCGRKRSWADFNYWRRAGSIGENHENPQSVYPVFEPTFENLPNSDQKV